MFKTRILWFISFLTVQLVLTGAISESAYSNGDPTGSSFVETGEASWYGPGFHGRKTASGEIFSHEKLTAACNVLPLGTWVKVTNLKNGKSIIVKTNDRLHTKTRRIIDLTRAGAKKLDYIHKGLTRVKIEVLDK